MNLENQSIVVAVVNALLGSSLTLAFTRRIVRAELARILGPLTERVGNLEQVQTADHSDVVQLKRKVG
jgi:hypothetical protein